MKEVLEGKSPEKRLEILRANADKVEQQKVKTNYTEQQMAEMKVEAMASSIELVKLDKAKKKAAKKFNDQIKPLKESSEELLLSIDKGYYEAEQEVFGIANQEAGMMEFFDMEGEMISSRPLLKSERQLKIASSVG